MTATITVPDLPNLARFRAEGIVTGYAHGRIKSTSLYYEFFGQCCPHLPPDIEAAFEDACNAYHLSAKAQVGDYDLDALEPDLQHPEVYAERCRTQFEDTLASLIASLDARTTRKQVAA